MGIYDVNYSKLGQQMLPPDKRAARQRAWIAAALYPIQWLRDLWLGSYRSGGTGYPPYINSTTYGKGERVVYRYSVYESNVSGNLGNDPLNTTYWTKVQDNFIGVNERIRYTGHVLVLEYALNRYFGTVFRQPPNVSDIFIQDNVKPQSVFVIGGDEDSSSVIYGDHSSEVIIDSYSFDAFNNMTIMVPTAVYNALDTDPLNREKIIRNFADQLIVAGITYDVSIY